ncbi:hypothetical protein Q3G72_008402 [Acer saccharum]|nr:hypothetical protein Q3G72_008402 [Acer saccharum]
MYFLCKILWSIADPSNALAFGPVTLANGVIFAGSTHGKWKLRLRIEDPPRRKHLGGAVLAGIMIYEGTYAMNKNADFETVWEIKEKLCYELIEVEGDGKADMVFRCIQEMDIDNIMREDAIDDFRVGKILVLIATDVIAHGMDFKGVNCVINYDFPDSAAAYIHRIGRSGRAGRSGEAISFYAEDDIPFLRNIAFVMEASGCEVPSWIKALPNLRGKKHRPRRESISTKPKDKTEGEANQKVTKGEEASPTKSFDFNQNERRN